MVAGLSGPGESGAERAETEGGGGAEWEIEWQTASAFDRLDDRRKLFVTYYIGESNCSMTDAARRVGFKHPKVLGWRLYQEPDVRAAIDEWMEAQGMAANEILMRLTEIGRGAHDATTVRALELLGKRYGLWTDKLDLTSGGEKLGVIGYVITPPGEPEAEDDDDSGPA